MMSRILISLLVLALLVPATLGQENVSITSSTVGPITLSHPESWYALAGSGGTVVLANFDPHQLTAENPAPEDALIVQIRLLGLNRVGGLEAEEQTAYNIMGGLLQRGTEGTELPEIAEIETERLQFARADVSNADVASYAYVVVLNEVTFSIITYTTNGSMEILDANEAAFLAAINTMELAFETPIPEGAASGYVSLEQTTTEQGFPMLGDPAAPVTVSEISSFDCPACRVFHDNLLPLLLDRVESGEINFVYVPIYGTGSLPDGDSAARAVLCVAPENFWAFHDTLFSWQDFGGFAFAYERLAFGVALFGIDLSDFDACYASDSTNAILEAARQFTFEALGQQWRTPTILVNGGVIEELSAEAMMDAIDAALAASE